MGVIVRTAGSERSKAEIKRDFEYLLRLWDEIRELTLKSTAPALIYEEGNLIKRSIRDLYARDIDEVLVDGEEGYRTAKAFMKMLMPSHAKRVKLYRDPDVPLFQRYQIEARSTPSTRPWCSCAPAATSSSTRPRRWSRSTSIPAAPRASATSRRPRSRPISRRPTRSRGSCGCAISPGLIVIDFIDMEEHRNHAAVERRLKEAMRHDRARIQFGRISPFGLLEMSRQRLRPSLVEASTAALPPLRRHRPYPLDRIDGAPRAARDRGGRHAPPLGGDHGRRADQGRALHPQPEARDLAADRGALRLPRHDRQDDTLVPPAFRLERLRALTPAEIAALPTFVPPPEPAEEEDEDVLDEEDGGRSTTFAARATRLAAGAASDLPPRQPQPAESEGGRGRGDVGRRLAAGAAAMRDEGRRRSASDRAPARAAPPPSARNEPYDETDAEADAASPRVRRRRGRGHVPASAGQRGRAPPPPPRAPRRPPPAPRRPTADGERERRERRRREGDSFEPPTGGRADDDAQVAVADAIAADADA